MEVDVQPLAILPIGLTEYLVLPYNVTNMSQMRWFYVIVTEKTDPQAEDLVQGEPFVWGGKTLGICEQFLERDNEIAVVFSRKITVMDLPLHKVSIESICLN